MKKDSTQEREKVIRINEEAIRDHLGKLVRSTVEETLNGRGAFFKRCQEDSPNFDRCTEIPSR